MPLLSLKVDYAFKKFFVTSEDLLIDFLNAILHHKHSQVNVTWVKVLNPELPGEAIDDKASILDILAKDEHGNTYNIEMQASSFPDFVKRAAFYAFRLYVNAIEKGDSYTDITSVYSINLLDFNIFPGLPFHRCFRILDSEDSVLMTDSVEFHFIELMKLKENIDSQEALDAWIYFIRDADHMTDIKLRQLIETNPLFRKATLKLEELSMDSQTRLEYDRRQYAIREYERTLKKSYQEGEEHGFSRGQAEGEKAGEYKKALATARIMKEEKLPPELIARVTGLSIEEINSL